MGNVGDDGTGYNTQGKVEKIEASRHDDPKEKKDEKSQQKCHFIKLRCLYRSALGLAYKKAVCFSFNIHPQGLR